MMKLVAKAPQVPILSLKVILKARSGATHQMRTVGDAPGKNKDEVIVTEYNRNRIAVPYSAAIAPSITI